MRAFSEQRFQFLNRYHQKAYVLQFPFSSHRFQFLNRYHQKSVRLYPRSSLIFGFNSSIGIIKSYSTLDTHCDAAGFQFLNRYHQKVPLVMLSPPRSWFQFLNRYHQKTYGRIANCCYLQFQFGVVSFK